MDVSPDKPLVARPYCPGCEPNADVLSEVLDVQWCDAHLPARDGSDDALVTSQGALLSGTVEAGGDDNRGWCALIHRQPPKPARSLKAKSTRRSSGTLAPQAADPLC